ncbi:MAG: 2-oxoacid:acceptor oxidoreductase subunit alpha [bacterium]|nr:MAG: 2-oxoacid:acceptor oxidoreductase subunit alpha [bacterium]
MDERVRDVTIVVGGEAGQGIQTIEFILTRVLKRSGYHVFATKEYMSRIRGGSNSTLIRVGSQRVPANVDRIDLLVPLDSGALTHLAGRISKDTLIIGEKKALKTEHNCVDIPFAAMAEEAGGKIYANTVAIGFLCGILEADLAILENYLKEYFGRKGKEIVARNVQAAGTGYRAGGEMRSAGRVAFSIDRDPSVAGNLLVSGAEAVSLGAISGGCRFISSYPMSPGTAILTYLSRHSEKFGIVAEQAEDEIAAVNMAVGASYAGARAMVTTSGGGFALMEEGVSLAGITETPLVIHLGQRPGPATGMATRTEQADLDLALYAGHGEFPRIIYAPGRTEDAFVLTHRAFNMADRYQVPVFVLTDQYFLDSYYSTSSLGDDAVFNEDHVIETDESYMRYRLTEDGISPRGVPGFGTGLVAVDSHEHTEEGHITEEIGVRNAMMDKRMGKIRAILADSVPPVLTGPEDYRVLVVGWGSNFHIIAEAVQLLRKDDISCLHFSQVFPLPPDTAELLDRAEVTVVVENNFGGQFARLLRAHTGFEAGHRILQYDGRPFCSELLARKILKIARRN